MNPDCQDIAKRDSLVDKLIVIYAKKGVVKTRAEMLASVLSKAKPKAKARELRDTVDKKGSSLALSLTKSAQTFIIDSATVKLDKVFDIHVQYNVSLSQFVHTDNLLNLVVITSEGSVMIWDTETWENQMFAMSVNVLKVLYFHSRWIGITCPKDCLALYDIKSNQLLKEATNVQCYCQHKEMLCFVLKEEGCSSIQMLEGPAFSLVELFTYSEDIYSIRCTTDYIIATTHHEVVGWKPNGDVILILALNNDTPSPLLLHNVVQYEGRLMVSVGLSTEKYTTYTLIVSVDKAGSFTKQRFLSGIQSGERVFVTGYYHYSHCSDKLSVHNIITGDQVMSKASDVLSTVHDTLPLFVTSKDNRITIFRISNEDQPE